uniref:F-box domain-containing protein n=1 Tax=Angiostrongylus cantonensis TaxID=6313 RepID=A0A158P8K4_ANGCA
MPQRSPILRCSSGRSNDNRLPNLPDEIIAHIVSMVSPTEIVALRWVGVNSGFDEVVEEHLKRSTTLNVCEDFIWQYLWSHLLVGSIIVCFHSRKLCGCLAEVSLHVKISDSEVVTCCGFRSLIRYLLEVTNSHTIWNLTLEDCTTSGQGYQGLADLTRNRNKVLYIDSVLHNSILSLLFRNNLQIFFIHPQSFICYVRTLLDLNTTINRLTLLDRRKVSPYMMITSPHKRRSIYMYPEFKCCHELFVCYDIGLIAPQFAHHNDRFTSLRIFEVEESHVFYKKDLLEYLSNAPNLCELRVVVPATWCRRVSRCTKGCFKTPDFACFRYALGTALEL